MEMTMSQVIDKEKVSARKTARLPLPDTFPDNGNGYEVLSLVDNLNDDDGKMHIALADGWDHAKPETWGVFLCEAARVITRDHADFLHTTLKDGELFEAICDGFKKRAAQGFGARRPII
jgi:hypothetical protein